MVPPGKGIFSFLPDFLYVFPWQTGHVNDFAILIGDIFRVASYTDLTGFLHYLPVYIALFCWRSNWSCLKLSFWGHASVKFFYCYQE